MGLLREWCLIISILSISCFHVECGTKEPKVLNVDLVYPLDFNQASEVNDIIYIIRDLDEINDVLYPYECTQGLGPGCGFGVNDEPSLRLCFEPCDSDPFIIPEHRIQLIYCARDSAAIPNTVYKGTSGVFYNDPNNISEPISITVETSVESCF